jgi:hypothetical protein
LRRRCGLFEHFVGDMQPVLARARRMLQKQEAVDLDALSAAEEQIRQDPVLTEVYVESSAVDHATETPTLTSAQVADAIQYLRPGFGFRIKQVGTGAWAVSGAGIRKFSTSAELKVLESDDTVEPLSPFSERVRELAERLGRPGERLPLVVGSFQRGAFRVSVAYWLKSTKTVRVTSFAQFRTLVDEWDGGYPDPGEWQRVEQIAQKEAQAELAAREASAETKEHAAMERQIAAARLRLLREMGRYLVCVADDAADLNRTLYEQMNRDIASTGRLKACLDRLAGLPEWPAELTRELSEFRQQVTTNQRKARLLGSEIDAALEDPRWKAAMIPANEQTTPA